VILIGAILSDRTCAARAGESYRGDERRRQAILGVIFTGFGFRVSVEDVLKGEASSSVSNFRRIARRKSGRRFINQS
jgi:hypothetical protein